MLQNYVHINGNCVGDAGCASTVMCASAYYVYVVHAVDLLVIRVKVIIDMSKYTSCVFVLQSMILLLFQN